MLPAQQLNIAGIHSTVGMLSKRENAGFSITRTNNTRADNHSIIVLKVVMDRVALEAIPFCKARGQKIVVDIDDLFDEIHETNFAASSTDPDKNKDRNREIYKQIIAEADALICSTPFIEEYYRKMYPSKPMFVVRNAIDIDRWKRLSVVKRKPIIGWLGATPWRSKDLEAIADFFPKYIESRDLIFHHAGHIPWAPPAFLQLGIQNKQRCTASPMVPLYQLPEAYNHFDIGIVPLNDIPFNRAKSFIKGIEYAAAGIPFVASDLPEYRFLAENGVGRVAKNAKEWQKHMDELMDIKIREDESVLNREIVEKKFSISATAKSWVEVFRAIHNM